MKVFLEGLAIVVPCLPFGSQDWTQWPPHQTTAGALRIPRRLFAARLGLAALLRQSAGGPPQLLDR